MADISWQRVTVLDPGHKVAAVVVDGPFGDSCTQHVNVPSTSLQERLAVLIVVVWPVLSMCIQDHRYLKRRGELLSAVGPTIPTNSKNWEQPSRFLTATG